MKKIISAALATIILAMGLSGCGDEKEISNTSSESTTTESTPAESTESTESAPEESSEPVESDDEVVDPSVVNAALEYPDNRAGQLVKAILAEDDWGYMTLMDAETAPVLISDFSTDDCEEYCMAYCENSTQLLYAIAVKPNEGSEDKVNDTLTAFYDNIQNNPDLAFYPMQQAAAEGAVKFAAPGGYVVIIVHENGQTIANAIDNVQ